MKKYSAVREERLGNSNAISKFTAALRLAGFFALMLPLMPVQAILLKVHPATARRFPHWFHKRVCRLLGIRIHVEGEVPRDCAILLIANHSSWLDIPVISTVAPVSFIAKSEVGGWPVVSTLAHLQRSVFVDRQRRTAVGQTAGEIVGRLAQRECIVLFAEGTSSDGNRVLPFKTSLFGAAKPTVALGQPNGTGVDAEVRTLAVAYTHLHGIPLGNSGRAQLVGWYGDMELVSHAWALLQAGPLDVHIKVGEPHRIDSFADRKELARQTEASLRTSLTGLLRRGGHVPPGGRGA